MNSPYPVRHGSMYAEPESLEECNRTRCYKCAYQDLEKVKEWMGGPAYCEHREVLIQMENKLL